jgi:hypothetical protein
MKTSWIEWVLLPFTLAFTLAGVLMMIETANSREFLPGLACTVFFGLCTFVFVQTLWARRQSRAHGADLSVTLQYGSVLRMGKTRLILLALAVGVPGTLFFLLGHQENDWIIAGAGGIAALAGIVLLALLALKAAGSAYIAFEKEGLRVGDSGGSMLMAWDNITRLITGEFNRNQMVFFWFKDTEALALSGKGTSRKWTQAGILKEIGGSRAVYGCDWGTLTGLYGVNAMLLAKAVVTYASDPKVREGLEDHLRLGA